MENPKISFRADPPGLKEEVEQEAAKRKVKPSWLYNRLIEEGLKVARTKGLNVLKGKVGVAES